MVLIAAVPVMACILHDASVGKTVLNTCQEKYEITNVIQHDDFYCICCHFLVWIYYRISATNKCNRSAKKSEKYDI